MMHAVSADLNSLFLASSISSLCSELRCCSSLRNSALGTLLIFHVHYDSGERLSVYAEGGAATLPDGWCGTEVFLEFFMEKLQAEEILLGKEGR